MPTRVGYTAKQQYDDLKADLAAGTHDFNGRPVLEWSEHPGEAAGHLGKTVIAIQYGGPQEGDGGLLKEYAFDPADLADEVAAVPVEPVELAKTTRSAAILAGASPAEAAKRATSTQNPAK